MFNKLVASDGKKKSSATATTTIVSVVAHGALLSLLAVGVHAETTKKKNEELVDYVEVADKPNTPPPPKEEPPPPPPPKQEEAPPVVKGTQELVPPQEPPQKIPDVDPNQHAVNAEDFSGQGKLGGVANGVENGVAQDVSRRDAPPDEGTYELAAVEEQPTLSNAADVQRTLSRNYPPLLRDAGVEGSVTVRVRVMEDGKADPSSISIENSTNDQFADAAKRVVERMRFRPAKVGGKAVRVWVTVPINFTVTR
ncbi:MAG TPA: TonB family protein [Longimicrobiaceae bacterium]|jgi:protein TonB|nr:TonB family protein [Longimicrobiaceae bacterium]